MSPILVAVLLATAALAFNGGRILRRRQNGRLGALERFPVVLYALVGVLILALAGIAAAFVVAVVTNPA